LDLASSAVLFFLNKKKKHDKTPTMVETGDGCASISNSNSEERIEDWEIYRLNYESQPIAAGGEVLQSGDHVYMECTMYQHHGIVLEETKNTDDAEQSILIAEFTNVALLGTDTIINALSTSSGAVSGNGVTGGFRYVNETQPSKWHKVKYRANPLEWMTWRPGTCSAASPSPVQTILARVQFLNDCRHLIPDYHLLASNCETVAIWCVTGKWETLQGGRAMQWSMGGAFTSISMVALPVLGIAAAGLAIVHSMHISKKWEETGALLNKEFQWYAMGTTPKLVVVQPKP
jgi:hypothetical protein